MTYDKDIRICRLVMGIIGLLQIPGIVIVLLDRKWWFAAVCVGWVYACFEVRRSMAVQQKTRDGQRLITATLNGRLAEEIGYLSRNCSTDEIGAAATRGINDLVDAAYGYRSYTCPKCGRLSHIPAEVEPYCIECLTEFKCSD